MYSVVQASPGDGSNPTPRFDIPVRTEPLQAFSFDPLLHSSRRKACGSRQALPGMEPETAVFRAFDQSWRSMARQRVRKAWRAGQSHLVDVCFPRRLCVCEVSRGSSGSTRQNAAPHRALAAWSCRHSWPSVARQQSADHSTPRQSPVITDNSTSSSCVHTSVH